METITIEVLAERLGGKMWVKDDLKRIYLDEGHNTKKMSTKTFVFEKDGEFIVSCRIDCPSQAYQWIKSQEEEVKESVYGQIEKALATEVYLIKDTKTGGYEGYKGTLNNADIYYSEVKAVKAARESLGSDFTIVEMDRVEFETEVERLDEIERQKRLEEKAAIPMLPVETTKTEKTQSKDTIGVTFGVDSKVKHNMFGIGTVVSETEIQIDINFETAGFKKLLKRFANLEKA